MISDLEAISLSNVANFSTLVTWHATICRMSSVLSLSFGASLSDCFKTSLKSVSISSASISYVRYYEACIEVYQRLALPSFRISLNPPCLIL